jgi:hypothetical protein
VLDDSSARPFRWLTTIWISWHALAVVIAELCVQTEGPLVERAWRLVDAVFEETARHIADSNHGRLWRPIKKLMNRAQVVRKKYLDDSTSIPWPLSPYGDPGLAKEVGCPITTQDSNMEVMSAEVGSNTLDDVVGRAHQSVNTPGRISVCWDPLETSGRADRMEYNQDLNQMAWTNWESFIDDLQADGGLVSGRESWAPPSFNMW